MRAGKWMKFIVSEFYPYLEINQEGHDFQFLYEISMQLGELTRNFRINEFNKLIKEIMENDFRPVQAAEYNFGFLFKVVYEINSL